MFSYVENIIKCATDGLEKPEYFNYHGPEDMFNTWGFCGIDKNRDSNCLDVSNFNCITEDLVERFPDDFRVEGYSHWAVGHVDRLCVRILKDKEQGINVENITEAFIAAMFWKDELNDYPVANDDDYLDMLYQESIDFLQNYLPDSILKMIDTSNENWASIIYSQLTSDGIEFDPDAQRYPTDFEVVEAVYNAKIWSNEAIEEWNDWTNNHSLTAIEFMKENPNQLSLF